MELILKKNIKEIIQQNYSFASILHYFGVKFTDYVDMSLGELCAKQNINVSLLLKHIDSSVTTSETALSDLRKYPLPLLIDYLKQSHYIFVKVRLPYIASLIKQNDILGFSKDDLEDLRYLFDMFAMDFIQHVKEEEDEMFNYILELIRADEEKQISIPDLHKLLNMLSILDEAIEHASPDEDMRFIRELNDKYILTLQSGAETSLEMHVLFSEMKSFEKDLSLHARIENEILFPRSIQLEKKLKDRLKALVSHN